MPFFPLGDREPATRQTRVGDNIVQSNEFLASKIDRLILTIEKLIAAINQKSGS